MSRFPGADRFLDAQTRHTSKLKNANPLVSKTRTAKQLERRTKEAKEKAEDAARIVGSNDNVPPGPPRNVAVEAWSRALSVTWDEPPFEDYVDVAEVVYTRTDDVTGEPGETKVLKTKDTLAILTNLRLVEYEIVVRLRDKWGLWSEPTAAVMATPQPTVADQIDEAVQIDAENISGILGEEKIGNITDPSKLVDATLGALKNASDGEYGESWHNAVGGNLLAAWTATIGRAVIAEGTVNSLLVEDGAIGNAKIDRATVDKLRVLDADIVSMSADKIRAGELEFDVGITEGSLTWPNGVLDAGGITLTELGSSVSFPSANKSAWIAPRLTPAKTPSPFAGVGFFSTGSVRGVQINADGVAGEDTNALIRLCATRGTQDNNAASTAILTINSLAGGGYIGIKEDLTVNRHINTSTGDIVSGRHVQALGRIFPSAELQANVDGGGGIFTLNHGRGTEARLYSCQYRDPNGNWREFVDQVAGFSVVNTDNVIRVVNNNSATLTVRISYYG